MSFDLWFDTAATIMPAPDALRAWFSARLHYEIENPDQTQAFYQNPRTGVYFWFEWPATPEQAPEEAGYSFSVNFFRPNTFSQEAAIELQTFTDTFSLLYVDPQEEDEAPRAFDANRFIDSYRRHNHWACHAMQEQHGANVVTLPSDQLQAIWEWNYTVEQRQNELTEDIFIPQIIIANLGGTPCPSFVWTDGIPTLMPDVTHVILHRNEVAPRKFGLFKSEPMSEILPIEQVQALLDDYYEPVKGKAGHRQPTYLKTPSARKAALQKLPRQEQQLEAYSFDQIIDDINHVA